MIDTHAHLDACAEPAPELLARAHEAGVGRVIAVGSGIESCRETLAICEREDDVFAALGIHPHEAREADARDVAELRELLAHPKAVAVGETGLDYYRGARTREEQERLFEAHLELASELGKPAVIHTREAPDDTTRALEAFAGTVVLHCFSEPALYPAAAAHGWYVSFAGNVTYPAARELREVAEQVRADRLLAETDSPYLAPQPVRGRPNEPAHVVHTLQTLAEVRGEEQSELERRIEENAACAFDLP